MPQPSPLGVIAGVTLALPVVAFVGLWRAGATVAGGVRDQLQTEGSITRRAASTAKQNILAHFSNGGTSLASFSQYGNDFELVIRATKELEWLLVTEFRAPSGHGVGLHDQITEARHEGKPLPLAMIRTMRRLVTIRNKMVHDRDFNDIPGREEFAISFDRVVEQLRGMLKRNGADEEDEPGCSIC